MSPTEMLAILLEYDAETRRIYSEGNMQLTHRAPLPQSVNYADQLQRDKNNEVIYETVSSKDFSQKITQYQKIKYNLSESFYIKTFQSRPNFQYTEPAINLDKYINYDELYKKLAVIKIDGSVGYGLFVVAKDGLSKGTSIPYASTKLRSFISIAQAFDPYNLKIKDDTYTNLTQGGLARFVNGVPTQEAFDNYTFAEEETYAKIAHANVEFVFEDEYVAYKTTRDIAYGEQLLCDWGNEYWHTLFQFFHLSPQLFDRHTGQCIAPEDYFAPVCLIYPNSSKSTFIPYEILLQQKASIQLYNPDKDQTAIVSQDELEAILHFTSLDHSLFYKSILSLNDWQQYHTDYFTSPPKYLNLYMSPDGEERKNKMKKTINQIAMAAYNKEDYETSIKLTTWLIFLENLNRLEEQNQSHLDSWLWNLANAYGKLNSYEEANYLLEQIKQPDNFKNFNTRKNEFMAEISKYNLCALI